MATRYVKRFLTLKLPIMKYEHNVGKKVLLFGVRYNYSGILESVDGNIVRLVKAVMVFDTGDFKDKDWATAAEPKTDIINVNADMMESYVVLPD